MKSSFIMYFVTLVSLLISSNETCHAQDDHRREVDASIKSYLVPFDTLELRINNKIQMEIPQDSLIDLTSILEIYVIRVSRNGKVKKIYWDGNDNTNAIFLKHRDIVQIELENLRHFNNKYIAENGKVKRIREVVFMYSIDKDGLIHIELPRLCECKE